MRFGSLFSGIGGFDLGLEWAGMACAWQVEIDERASAVLSRHWPHVKRYQDVRHIGAGVEPVDLVCGGFPCQDVSVAGRRAGLAGERSGLWFEFHRVLAELRPGWCLIENVPGLLSSNGGRDFAVILRGLVELGYGVCWRVLDAQYFGLAQRRRRVFIVGSLGDGRAAEVLFEREGGAGDTTPRREAGKGVAGTITERFAGASNQWAPANEADNLQVAYTLSAHHQRNNHEADYIPIAFAERTRAEGRTLKWQEEVAYSVTNQGAGGQTHGRMIAAPITASYGKQVDSSDRNGGPPNLIQVAHTLRAEGHDASEDGTGRGVPVVAVSNSPTPSWAEELSPTLQSKNGLRSASGGRMEAVAGAFGVRRLMPVECERLQGFPDGWTGGQADSARYRQLGNAVAVQVAEWLGRRILAAAGESGL